MGQITFARFCAAVLMALVPLLLCAQKPSLENRHYPDWVTEYQPKVNKTGKYVVFQSKGKWNLYSIGNKVKMIRELPAGQPEFSADGKSLVLKDINDTLHILALDQTLSERKISGVADWALSPGYLIFLQRATSSLHLTRLSGGSKMLFKNVHSFQLNANKTHLVYLSGDKRDTIGTLDLEIQGNKTVTGFAHPVTAYFPAPKGDYIAVRTSSSSGEQELTVMDSHRGTALKTASLLQQQGAYRLSEQNPWFGPDGKYLFLSADTVENANQDSLSRPISTVEVWHYQDRELQSMQVNHVNEPERMTAACELNTGNLQVISHRGEDAVSTRETNPKGYQLIFSKSIVYESGWDVRNKVSCWLREPITGKRTQVFQQVGIPSETQVSPDARFVVWFDNEKHAYFSFDIQSHTTRKLTLGNGIRPDFTEEDPASTSSQPIGLVGWLPDGRTFFVYDRFDIWQIDPSGKVKPVLLTAGWGRSHQIRLRLPESETSAKERKLDIQNGTVLQAFDINTKQSGFVRLDFRPHPEVSPIYMGPYVFSDVTPVPGKNAYILCRSSEKEAPNIFWSGDLKSFSQLSNFAPQKQLNWLSSELVELKRKDGSVGQAILYKPEDFDPHKKYPAIVHFYEKRSDQLHQFLMPALSRAEINVPFYVSNGYLVLVPDIDYSPDSLARAAFACVQPGVDYLKNLDFVDAKAIGMQGHSFGAYQTNFILTRTRDIAAACSAAGLCDLISASTTLNLDGHPHYTKYDLGQMRKPRPLWEDPETYIRDSPLFYVDRITTPLLLMHNRKDPVVNFEQDVQLYLSLRRLGKPVWLLQYPNSGHIAYAPDEKDFSIRMLQFFDHFLKHRPAPVWLSEGIPAKRAKIDSGLEF